MLREGSLQLRLNTRTIFRLVSGAVAPLCQLPAESFTRRAVLIGGALPFDVASLRSGLIEDAVGGLDQPGCFQLAQEIAGADQADTLIDDGAAALDVGIL